MDELKKLYDVLVRDGKYTKSFEEFQTKWSQDEQYKNKVYDVVSRDGIYTKDRNSFFQKYSVAAPSNEVEGSTPGKTIAPSKKKFALESSSEDGLLESQQPPKEQKPAFSMPKMTQEEFKQSVSEAIKNAPKNDRERFLRQQQKELKESLAVIKETKARQIQEKKAELEQQKEAEKANLGLRTKKDFTTTLNSVVNSNLTSKTEEDAIADLRRNFERYGISFEETGFGTDKIIARTIDGKKSIEIDFDNWTTGGRVAAANKLKDFISQNASEVTRAQSGDFLNNSLKAKNLRKVGMINPDGSTSTVQFTSFEEDGKFKVIPTLFPKDPNNYSTNPNSWTKLQFKEALKLARERGEVFEFKTDKEAREFAKGAWKDINPIDAEADKFYKQKGLDYMSNKKTYEEYVKVRDMVDFIEERRNDRTIGSDERAQKYSQLLVNGRFRSDVDQLLEKYKAQEKQLRGQVFDAGFISEGKIQKTREEFDEYLDKRQSKISQEAAQLNARAKVQAQDAEVKSMGLFGLSAQDLMKYKPKTEQEAIDKQNIIKLYEDSKLTQSFAAKKYENAKTYFDAKVNKQIKGEYEDNWSAFTSSWLDALNNGRAAEQILAFGLGIKDVDSKTDKAEAARIIVENLTNQSPNSNRVMARWEQASGFAEGLDAFLDNPFELALTMAATSLSQILPYGSKIVPATTAAGAGTGAVTGLLGGPFAEITVPGGAITGGVQGFRTGMAATSLAMEYTNSVLDVMREKGYDVTDPNQVEKAFDDESVWSEGRERGLKRGIPIAVVDYLSAGLAGKVFKPTSAISSTGRRVALQTTERAVFDPLAEATGELAAQVTAGQEIDWKEISAEAMGGLGNNSSNMAINTYRTIKNNTDINIANNLTDISFLGTDSASDERISTWANNMQQLGKIDADVNQRIQENVGLRRDARDVLSVGIKPKDVKSDVLARTMELMSAKEQLSSSVNRREIYSDKIKAINNELAVIAETKELAPEAQSVNLDTTIGTTREGVGQYMIDGVRYTKEQFLEKTKNMSARRILRSALSVKNDEEIGNELKQIVDEKLKSELTTEELTNLLTEEEDAVQIESTTEVPVQSETGISETVAEGISQPKPETVTETQKEIAQPLRDVESTATALESLPVEERNIPLSPLDLDNEGIITWKQNDPQSVAEAYHRAKEEGSNSELVQAVETLLTPTPEATQPQTIIEEQTAEEEISRLFNDENRFQADYAENKVDYFETEEATKEGFEKYKNSLNLLDGLQEYFKGGSVMFNGKPSMYLDAEKTNPISLDEIAELYHKAKADNSNPELVQAVEKGLTSISNIEENAYRNNEYLNKIKQEVSSKTQPTTETETQDETGKQSTVQSERTGDGRTRRAPISKTTPLEGTPKVEGATGPDQQLVSVAEKYASENGIDLKRQGEYVEVNEERAKRIADAYEAMANDPQNPKVKEAYAELIKQTKAQYQALVDAGYKFWFIDLNNPENIDYISSPYNAMRDLRQNKQMGVFPTEEGFGSNEDVDVSQNPLLEDTGIMWAVGGLDGEMKPVTANDLFRAVHDAFGHGLEGAGFRARGEENAFQAHSRLYTGSAIGAMASETRGQNSWVNFGPFGEQNRTASAEDTVFADQKVGLMPEFTWTEGLAPDMQIETETEAAEQTPEVQETIEPTSQELNEQDLPGYDRMMGEVEGIIEKSKKRRVSEAKIADNVMSYVMGSKVYENATDVQREALVRDIRKRFGLREKAAPSVARLFGKIKDVKKITMTEKVALKKQIRDLARGARDAVRAFRLASQQLSKDIKELRQSGKITADQAANVIRAFSKVNVFSAKSVDRFTTYMTKVFENADYAAKIKDARGFRSSLKKLSKNKDKNANLRVAAAQFVKIDPALIEDIEAYNEMASKIKEAITGSSIRGQKVRFAETVNIQEATDYTSKTLKEQEEKVRQEMIAELQGLLDTDLSELTAEEAGILLGFYGEGKTVDTKKYNEGIIRAAIKKAFNVYSSVIKESIKTGKDIFTDEDVEYTTAQKEIINKFMNMDTDKMSAKDSLAAVDSLINFLTNQSTAKMEAVVRKYTGQQNAAKIRRENIFAVPLKKLGMKGFGRFLGEQTTNLNILFEKMFVGFNRSGKVRDAMGLTDLVNGKSKAQRQTNTIVANYVSEFYNKKANNQKFNTLYNNVERGMASFMSRNIIGTEAEMQAEFDRRKKLIEQSIEVLSIGNEQERKKALVYQEVYDKVLDGSTNIDEVQSKVDPTNLEAVDFWIREWDSKFDELSDTALNIYNKVLDKDLNYTPDRFTRMSYDGGSVDLANTASAFITNTNGNLYKKETGVLMEATRPEELPRNADTNETDSFIDLSFDKNNSNSMYDALVDINTAGPIRQVEAFMNTADFRKIFGVDADLIKGTKSSVGRIQQYINNIRNKNPYSNDEFAKAMRSLNKIATLGVGQALAGPTQPLKQVVPVVFNTLINAKGNVDFSAMSNKDFMSWLNESGYAIANRGVESQADVDSINKMIDEAAESKGAKAVKLLEDANKKWLTMFLVKPDVWIAVSSWKSYYEQSLRDRGIDTKGIDYSTHELNKEAADYAQRMVDRQQNVSDTDMAGTMFSNKNPYAQTMVKIFMPFASFRMNQASRLGADLRVLSNWDVSTAEDKKIAARSLAGYAVEMAAFRTLSAGLAVGIASMTASLMGKGDNEEEKKKRREFLVKGAVTSVVTDVLSPIPVLDRLVQSNSAMIIEGVQKGLGVADEDVKNIYNSRKINFVDALGTFGIAAKRTEEIWDLVSLSATGTYKDDYGRTKQISEENRQALTKLVAPVLIANVTGLASPEVSGVSRNAMKIAKKKSPTPEQIKEMRDKVDSIQEIIDKATSPQEIEAAEEMLNRVKYPERYKDEKEKIEAMKPSLLTDEETGIKYENQTDLKRYNPDLWEKNFGEGSEYYELNKPKKEAEKLFKDKEREAKDEKFGYTPKKKRRKNSDGTYKKSTSRRGFSGSSSSSESYDSDGLKTTKTRRGFKN
jgi:hypothetical protein